MKIKYPVKVNYEYTNNTYQAIKVLNNLPNLFAADFETASIYTKEEKEELKNIKQEDDYFEYRNRLQKINSNGLSHPSMTVITHLSVAWSDKDAYVIICDNYRIRLAILKFLTTTNKIQLWHNASFDFKHIMYNVHSIPKHYIDTQLLAKCILNDADGSKNNVRLKSLMAYAYGEWALSSDSFSLEEMYNECMIRYSATDSCATYKLFQDICEDIRYEFTNS